MKRLIYSLIFLFILTACSQNNVLTLKHRLFYSEENIIEPNHSTLFQDVNYNEPGTVDEEFSYELTFDFKDTAIAKTRKHLNLMTDTSIVKCNYAITSVWSSWGSNNYNANISGQIEIKHWSKNRITLKENIQVIDTLRKETKYFKGIRTFKELKKRKEEKE